MPFADALDDVVAEARYVNEVVRAGGWAAARDAYTSANAPARGRRFFVDATYRERATLVELLRARADVECVYAEYARHISSANDSASSRALWLHDALDDYSLERTWIVAAARVASAPLVAALVAGVERRGAIGGDTFAAATMALVTEASAIDSHRRLATFGALYAAIAGVSVEAGVPCWPSTTVLGIAARYERCESQHALVDALARMCRPLTCSMCDTATRYALDGARAERNARALARIEAHVVEAAAQQ